MQTISATDVLETLPETIFTTGAFVKQIKVSINGRAQYRWIVTSFEDDSFYHGMYINPNVYANAPDGMFAKDEE